MLDDVLDTVSAPIDESMFYISMLQHLGFGFGYGVDPLFLCDNERLEQTCMARPNVLPARLAYICPMCNFGEDGGWTELSDFFLWLADNFGDNMSVLENFSANVGTYGFSAVGSMSGYYNSQVNLFKPLFNHPNDIEAKWAKRMFKSEQLQANYEKFMDEYREVTGD